MENVTLWFACPWTLAVYSVQGGSEAMIALGTMNIVLGRLPQAMEGSVSALHS
jgi:hypothetical protein